MDICSRCGEYHGVGGFCGAERFVESQGCPSCVAKDVEILRLKKIVNLVYEYDGNLIDALSAKAAKGEGG